MVSPENVAHAESVLETLHHHSKGLFWAPGRWSPLGTKNRDFMKVSPFQFETGNRGMDYFTNSRVSHHTGLADFTE